MEDSVRVDGLVCIIPDVWSSQALTMTISDHQWTTSRPSKSYYGFFLRDSDQCLGIQSQMLVSKISLCPWRRVLSFCPASRFLNHSHDKDVMHSMSGASTASSHSLVTLPSTFTASLSPFHGIICVLPSTRSLSPSTQWQGLIVQHVHYVSYVFQS
jgi:hypothetical protein